MLIEIFHNKYNKKDAKKLAKIFEDNFIEVTYNICDNFNDYVLRTKLENSLYLFYDDDVKRQIAILYYKENKKEFNNNTIELLAKEVINYICDAHFLDFQTEIKNKFINLHGYPLKFNNIFSYNISVTHDEIIDYHKLLSNTTCNLLFIIQNLTRELNDTKERVKLLEKIILKE